MSLLTLIKAIQTVAKDNGDVALQEQLLQLREVALEVQEENFELKQKLQVLQVELASIIDKTYHYESPFYWKQEGINKDGPFCQHCLDVNKTAIRLQERIKGAWFCTNCDIIYKSASYQSPLRP